MYLNFHHKWYFDPFDNIDSEYQKLCVIVDDDIRKKAALLERRTSKT